MTKVLLIEDEESLGEALAYQLQREGYDVDRVTDGASGLDRFKANGADLVLLDLMLPGLAGEDVCREIRRGSQVPVIMLTAKDTEIDKVLGLELGADDYVTKPFSARELIARMKSVLRRSSAHAGQERALEYGNVRLDAERFEVSINGTDVHLPRKEFELLHILLENVGRVLSRETLIERVWGSDYVGDSRTLDVHIKRLRAKVEKDPSAPRHLVTVRGLGYKFVP